MQEIWIRIGATLGAIIFGVLFTRFGTWLTDNLSAEAQEAVLKVDKALRDFFPDE